MVNKKLENNMNNPLLKQVIENFIKLERDDKLKIIGMTELMAIKNKKRDT